MLLSGVLSCFANATLGRLLGRADYSVCGSLLSHYTILGTLISVSQMVVTSYVAAMVVKGNWPDVRGLTQVALR